MKREFLTNTSNKIKGFIQHIGVSSVLVAMWTEKGIKMYHEMCNLYSRLVDATSGISLKNKKEIFYFAYMF